jgi:hypothetical protein
MQLETITPDCSKCYAVRHTAPKMEPVLDFRAIHSIKNGKDLGSGFAR